jgi:hypothetical protein
LNYRHSVLFSGFTIFIFIVLWRWFDTHRRPRTRRRPARLTRFLVRLRRSRR